MTVLRKASYPVGLGEEQRLEHSSPLQTTQHSPGEARLPNGEAIAATTLQDLSHDWFSYPDPFVCNGCEGNNIFDGFLNVPQDQSLLPAPQRGSDCECSETAVKVIGKFSLLQQDLRTCSADNLLEAAHEAIIASERFAQCVPGCQRANSLLYITVLQQVDGYYSCLDKLLTLDGVHVQGVEVEVKVGTFMVKASLNTSLGRTVLSAGIQRAARCALQLSNALRWEDSEGDAQSFIELRDELTCQRRMFECLTTCLDNHLQNPLSSLPQQRQ